MSTRKRFAVAKKSTKEETEEEESSEEEVKDNKLQNKQKRGNEKKKKRKWWQCSAVKLMLCTFILLFSLNYISLKYEYQHLMPKGEMIDIGWGQRFFYRCSGSGEPLVVLDAPTGETSDIWTHIETAISKHTKVCVYDRAGLGFSDKAYKFGRGDDHIVRFLCPCDFHTGRFYARANTSAYTGDYSKDAEFRDRLQPGTVERMADDLYRLLQLVNKGSPVVLVGADFSTLISRFYAQLYEEQVKGLFLIDPMIETLFDNGSVWNEHWYDVVVAHINMLYLGGVVGLNRLALRFGAMKPMWNEDVLKTMTEDMVNRKRYFMCSSTHLSSVLDEIYLTNISLKQVQTMFKVKPFPRHIPITIATYENNAKSGNRDNLTDQWNEGHKILSTLIHPSSQKVSLPGSDHNVLYQKPLLVAAAIVKFVKHLRVSTGI